MKTILAIFLAAATAQAATILVNTNTSQVTGWTPSDNQVPGPGEIAVVMDAIPEGIATDWKWDGAQFTKPVVTSTNAVIDRQIDDAATYAAEWDLIGTLIKYSTPPASLNPYGAAIDNYYKLLAYSNSVTDPTTKDGVLADAQRMSFVWTWLGRRYQEYPGGPPAFAYSGARYITNTVPVTIYAPVP